MKRFIVVMAFCVFAASTMLAQAGKAPGKKAVKSEANTEVMSELQAMKAAIAAQQKQIEQLQQQLSQRDQALQQTQQQLSDAKSAAQQAQTTANEANTTAQGAQASVADLKATDNTFAQQIQEDQKRVGQLESPTTIHYKGVTITPGGFLAAETVYRQRGTGSDINTSMNSINFPGAGGYHQSEFYGSGRQSRISILGEGKLSWGKIGGYWEMDWLSSGTTSNNNQSNSYTNRQRQLFGQIATNTGWTITGGQMWSLVTETKKGVDNRTEATPMTIDPQYTVGFSWARQYGFRVAKNINNKVWIAGSIENAQTTFSARNAVANFAFGQAGNSGGLYNAFNGNYSYNWSPDYIAKVVFEPGIGHYEIFGVASLFRDRVYPNYASTTLPKGSGAYEASTLGGGVGVNARVSLLKKRLDIGAHALGGNGVGRYGTSGLPDVTVRPDGKLAKLRAGQALGTIEWHTPKIDIYGNAGVEYVGRYYNGTVGYGVPTLATYGCDIEVQPSANSGFAPGTPANCNADTRNVIEGTIGFWYKLYNGSKGRIQFGPQYSYLVRNTWAGAGATAGTSAQPNAVNNMFFTSFRYYLP
ncbi:MAG TPA: hypothetical protein VMU24_06740 [Candidatus Acidoferrales bacterium]|nr:hypothetical protein [Candidatus Acidoferrales bacterium]